MNQQSTSLVQLIQTRRSIRRYQSDPVPHHLIDEILQAGIWAPSAHNRQPWCFAVVESPDNKQHLATQMGARLTRDLRADHVPEEIIEKDVNRSYERITSAPVLIVVCLSMQDMDVYSDTRRNDHERTMAIQSTAMAGQNMLLTAHALGLSACWMCAPLFCPDVVSSALDLPGDWQSQGMITLGYPAQTREKSRNPIEMSVVWR